MGIGQRVFVISTADTVHRFSVQRFDRLHADAGIEAAPEFSGKKMRYIHVLLETVQRKPVKILNLECGFLQFDESGKVDSAARWDQMQLAVNMVDSGWVAHDAAALVEARHLFARREYDHKYRWKPSVAILKQVGEAIFGAV